MSNEKTVGSIRLDDVHWDILGGLTPFYGSTKSEVCRNIVLMWLHDNLGSSTIQELKNQKSIKLGENEVKDGEKGN